MPKLILIKHAAPVVTPGEPPERWPLSAAGRAGCGPLAEAIRGESPAAVVTSTEAKAVETGELLAAALCVPSEAAPDLGEHDRSNVPHMQTREFISSMELLFRKPSQRVLGRESADEALDRFRSALESAVARHAGRDVAVVSHGTVIALLLADLGGGKPFELWRRMGLPSYAVIDVGAGRLGWVVERVVERV